MSYKNLIIINNEKVFKENNTFYCDNLDLKIIPEGLNEHYKVQYIVRKSKKKGKQNIKLNNNKGFFKGKRSKDALKQKEVMMSIKKNVIQSLVSNHNTKLNIGKKM